MDKPIKQAQAVIGCTADNAAEFRAAIKRWPQLHGLVTGLQQSGLFPGMRCMQITLTGSPEFVGKGLAAIPLETSDSARDEGGDAH